MQVKVSITHTVIFEVEDSTPIEYIRTKAVEKIDEGYTDEEANTVGAIDEQVSSLLTGSVVGKAMSETTVIQVAEVK